MEKRQTLMSIIKPLTVIPLYNHSKTVAKIAQDSLNYCKDILIVDDGSKDGGAKDLQNSNINLISFAKNSGKGAAILAAVKYAKQNNFTHIITIDADGQHYPNDIAKLLETAGKFPRSIIIGKRDFSDPAIPKVSKFGRKFSGFWAKIQTGKTIVDIQSGFRIYPLEVFDKFAVFSSGFCFEVEIIVKALWAGFDVRETLVNVCYPKKGQRISHFNFISDNAKLGILNTYLTARSMFPIPHRKYIFNDEGQTVSLNPFKTVIEQMKKKENPLIFGISAAWGVFCGSLALPGIRNFILLLGVGWFNLNRLIAFSLDKLAMPPFIPFVCIEVGYFIRHKKFLTEISWQIIGHQFLQRVWEWFLGSLIVAPIFGLLIGFIVFIIGHLLRKGLIYGSKMDRKK
ncbi:MAG: DUF2062 domain-containing protein [Elusimicrobiota bacterium]|nr:DUF2062 domain-containing protein [Elusimicrobiota bacterium]